MALPTFGTDATGEDTYVVVIAARTAQTDAYNHIIAWCTTKDAILSLDGGDTDHIHLLADAAPIRIDFALKTGAVHAKNFDAGQNYGAVWANISRDWGHG